MAPPPLDPTPHGWTHPLAALGLVMVWLGVSTLPEGWLMLAAGIIIGAIGTTNPDEGATK